MLDYFKKLINSTNRSNLLKKNIIFSSVLTGTSLSISFIMVPITMDFISPSLYGVWLTISSLLTWFLFFEIGLGSGLRNSLSTALAKKDYEQAKYLVSTTYVTLSIIITIVAVIFFITNHFVDWCNLLNINNKYQEEINKVIIIVFSSFFFNFVFRLIGNIANAYQFAFIEKLFSTISQIICFIILMILVKLTKGNLIILSVIMSVIPLFTLLIGSIILFKKIFKDFSPSLNYFKFDRIKGLFGVGFQFFIIQLSLLIINSSTNIIISNRLGPQEVVVYNIAFRLFYISQIIYSIIISPTWSAFSNAIALNDYVWIQRIVKKMVKVWLLITSFMLLVLILSPIIYKLWVGNRVKVPYTLSILLFIHFSILTFGAVFNMFINASGKLKLQLWMWSIIAIIYVPLVFSLIDNTSLGIYCVAIGLLFSDLYYLLAPLQYKSILRKITQNAQVVTVKSSEINV